MQIRYIPEFIYICRECNFMDTTMTIDKCPCCGGDDWLSYNKEEEDE